MDTLSLIADLVEKTKAKGVQVRGMENRAGQMWNGFWNIFLMWVTTGVPIVGEQEMSLDKWELTDIEKLSFVGTDFRIVPLDVAELKECPKKAVLRSLSADYATNSETVAFWSLEHISTSAIVGVVRHTDLAKITIRRLPRVIPN